MRAGFGLLLVKAFSCTLNLFLISNAGFLFKKNHQIVRQADKLGLHFFSGLGLAPRFGLGDFIFKGVALLTGVAAKRVEQQENNNHSSISTQSSTVTTHQQTLASNEIVHRNREQTKVFKIFKKI